MIPACLIARGHHDWPYKTTTRPSGLVPSSPPSTQDPACHDRTKPLSAKLNRIAKRLLARRGIGEELTERFVGPTAEGLAVDTACARNSERSLLTFSRRGPGCMR